MADEPLERPWLPDQLKRVDEIQALPENWDSYHALEVTPLAAHLTRALLHMISAVHTVKPEVRPQLCPTSAGGIQIGWYEHDYNLEVEIEPDGEISVWLHRVSDDASVTWPPEQAAETSTP